MSRYIDAEWIRNIYADFEHYENRDDWTTPITNVLAVIDDAPSIDIVRCKECKYKDEIVNYCYENDRDVNSDDFCSYGVRKTNTTAEEKPTPIRDYMVHGERKESE